MGRGLPCCGQRECVCEEYDSEVTGVCLKTNLDSKEHSLSYAQIEIKALEEKLRIAAEALQCAYPELTRSAQTLSVARIVNEALEKIKAP